MNRCFSSIIFLIFIIYTLNACHNGVPNNRWSFSDLTNVGLIHESSALDLAWSVDNDANINDLNTSLKDMAWHLITLRVKGMRPTTTPVSVGGLLAAIYPKPYPDYGQQILIKDINCQSAIFGKIGDSCSTYFKLGYDLKQSLTESVDVPVQIAPKNIDSIFSFRAKLQPLVSIANFRRVNSFEEEYYLAKAIKEDRSLYQIFLVQNGSLLPFDITNIGKLYNPTFSLMHRSTITDDPYYGNYQECSSTTNSNLKQISHFDGLGESCILVYKVAKISKTQLESDSSFIDSSATLFFPSWANHYYLIAKYSDGTPIPDIKFNQLSGSIHQSLAFKSLNISYSFLPSLLPILNGSTSSKLVLPKSIKLWINQPVLTDVSSNSYIKQIKQIFPEGGVIQSGSTSINACGGAYASADAKVITYAKDLEQGVIDINFDINSSGHCGHPAPASFLLSIPMSGYHNIIYHVDDTGCAGGHWDMGGAVSLDGNCSSIDCQFRVQVSAHHGGVGGECNQTNYNSFYLNFPRPNTNQVAYLDNQDNLPIAFAATGGESLTVTMASKPISVNPTINCSTTKTCFVSGHYSTDSVTEDMTYLIHLNPGDIFQGGTIQFKRLADYDLDEFIINTSNHKDNRFIYR